MRFACSATLCLAATPDSDPVALAVSDRHYSVYILRCGDGSLYTGIAIDVARRLREHAAGARGAKYLRGRGPLQLVFSRPVGDRCRASRAEHRIKQLDRPRKEALIDGTVSFAELISD